MLTCDAIAVQVMPLIYTTPTTVAVVAAVQSFPPVATPAAVARADTARAAQEFPAAVGPALRGVQAAAALVQVRLVVVSPTAATPERPNEAAVAAAVAPMQAPWVVTSTKVEARVEVTEAGATGGNETPHAPLRQHPEVLPPSPALLQCVLTFYIYRDTDQRDTQRCFAHGLVEGTLCSQDGMLVDL